WILVGVGAVDHVGDLAEGSAEEDSTGRLKVGMVKAVEAREAELDVALAVARERDVLGDAEVGVVEPGAVEEISGRVAEGAGRLGRERRGVEVLVGRGVVSRVVGLDVGALRLRSVGTCKRNI